MYKWKPGSSPLTFLRIPIPKPLEDSFFRFVGVLKIQQCFDQKYNHEALKQLLTYRPKYFRKITTSSQDKVLFHREILFKKFAHNHRSHRNYRPYSGHIRQDGNSSSSGSSPELILLDVDFTPPGDSTLRGVIEPSTELWNMTSSDSDQR